ncbi:MAG: hypothetical protein R3F55_18685 [Alphaproteobacteria bacterium]
MTAASPLAAARAALAAGDQPGAEAILAAFVAEEFALPVAALSIRRDGYSLNSVNGFVDLADGRRFFFKFHQEEGEEATVEEYYRAELLAEAGYPVDRPAYVCRAVGRQILLYEARETPRFADLCKAAEFAADPATLRPLVEAQMRLDRLVGERNVATLHGAEAADYAAEPLLQLFVWRLVDDKADARLGGRAQRFYSGRSLVFPGLSLPAEELRRLTWRINGRDYPATLDGLFADALAQLRPQPAGRYPAVVAHGDAHNANVWYDDGQLSWFDPAFAGAHVPALLAEVKATFHNIFAHPLWLYHPQEADARLAASARREGDVLVVAHDWAPTPLRQAFLDSKAALYWRPVLAALHGRGMLPADWRQTVRLALFCCPTLVMNLSAGCGMGAAIHTPKTSLVGLSIAVMCGCAPADGDDLVSRFLDSVDPAA